MEPEGPLPHLQESATCPYSKPDQSSPCTPQMHFQKNHLNIIIPSMPGSSKWSLYLRFSHQNPVCTYPLPPMCYMLHPSHSSQSDHLNNIWWGVSCSLRSFLHSCYLVPLRPKYSPQHPMLKHPQPTFLPWSKWPNFAPIQNNKRNYSSVYLNL